MGPLVGNAASYPQYEAVRRQETRVLADLAAYAPGNLTLGSGEAARPLSAVVVTGNYFGVLGVRPHLGRFFTAEEDGAPGTGPVVVLSHAFWMRELGGQRGALGSTLRLNDTPLTVIGVAPRGFVGTDLGSPDVFLTTSMAATDRISGAGTRSNRTYWLQMLGRLRPDIDRRNVSAAQLYDPYAVNLIPVSYTALTAMFFADQLGANPIPVWVLGMAGAVVLLACATVANLLLAQATRRAREISVQLALGATRARIVRQLLLESLLLASVSALLALLVAMSSMKLIQALPIPFIARPIDVRTVGFASGLGVLTVLLFGLAPALWAARQNIAGLLNAGNARTVGGRFMVQRTLMVMQMGITFILLVSATLFLTSLRNVKAIDPGLDVDRLLTAGFNQRQRSDAELAPFQERALAQLRALPGVAAASAGNIVPFHSFSRYSFRILDGRPVEEQPNSILFNFVASDYLDTMGLRLIEGRAFNDSDLRGAEPVAMVSRQLARSFWRTASPLGACLDLYLPDAPCTRVVGIVSDARYQDLRREPTEMLYLPAAQAVGFRAATLFVRARGNVSELAAPVRRTLQSLDATLPFTRIEPLDARLRPQRIPWEVSGKLFLAFGVLASVLAAGGMFSIVAFIVQQRMRELGVRSALGAPRSRILRLVLGRALAISAAGVAAGCLGALLITRIFASQMVGVSASSPGLYAAVAIALTGITMLASYWPGHRAAGVDPAVTLRTE